mgnify:CR=1 FL=1
MEKEKDGIEELMDIFKTSLNKDEFLIVFTEVIRDSASEAYNAGYSEGARVATERATPKKSSIIMP